MKTCHNCRAIYSDFYNGTCTDCGAGMGSVPGGPADLEQKFAVQRSEANRSRITENQVEGRNYEGLRAGNPIFDTAQEFVIDLRSDEKKAHDEAIGA